MRNEGEGNPIPLLILLISALFSINWYYLIHLSIACGFVLEKIEL